MDEQGNRTSLNCRNWRTFVFVTVSKKFCAALLREIVLKLFKSLLVGDPLAWIDRVGTLPTRRPVEVSGDYTRHGFPAVFATSARARHPCTVFPRNHSQTTCEEDAHSPYGSWD
jgi:hypothetical protein